MREQHLNLLPLAARGLVGFSLAMSRAMSRASSKTDCGILRAGAFGTPHASAPRSVIGPSSRSCVSHRLLVWLGSAGIASVHPLRGSTGSVEGHKRQFAYGIPQTDCLDDDVQVTLNEFDGIGSCPHGGVDQGPASADVELPAMPGTPDDLTVSCIGEGAIRRFGRSAADRSIAKSCSAMRTNVPQGEVVSLDPEYADGSLLQFDDFGGPVRHLVRPAREGLFLCQGSPLTRRRLVGAGACRRSGRSIP